MLLTVGKFIDEPQSQQVCSLTPFTLCASVAWYIFWRPEAGLACVQGAAAMHKAVGTRYPGALTRISVGGNCMTACGLHDFDSWLSRCPALTTLDFSYMPRARARSQPHQDEVYGPYELHDMNGALLREQMARHLQTIAQEGSQATRKTSGISYTADATGRHIGSGPHGALAAGCPHMPGVGGVGGFRVQSHGQVASPDGLVGGGDSQTASSFSADSKLRSPRVPESQLVWSVAEVEALRRVLSITHEVCFGGCSLDQAATEALAAILAGSAHLRSLRLQAAPCAAASQPLVGPANSGPQRSAVAAQRALPSMGQILRKLAVREGRRTAAALTELSLSGLAAAGMERTVPGAEQRPFQSLQVLHLDSRDAGGQQQGQGCGSADDASGPGRRGALGAALLTDPFAHVWGLLPAARDLRVLSLHSARPYR